jgi:hypothetical protein
VGDTIELIAQTADPKDLFSLLKTSKPLAPVADPKALVLAYLSR